MKVAGTIALIALALPLTASASASHSTMGHQASPLQVYLLAPGQRALVPVARSTLSSTPAGLLRALLAGPTASEYRNGLRTALPRNVAARGVRLSRQNAVVALNGAMPSAKDTFTTLKRLSQIVFTLTELPQIRSVSVTLNGRPWGVVDMHGKLIRIYSRAFFTRQGTICGDTGQCFSP